MVFEKSTTKTAAAGAEWAYEVGGILEDSK
jgi:hypothetical protein